MCKCNQPLFTYAELGYQTQQEVLSKWAQGQLDYEWWECTFDDVKAIAEFIGITISDIYFSGFASQGDGACFVGEYQYQPGWRKALAKEYGKDNKSLTEVIQIAEGLQKLQSRYFYKITGNCKHKGHYYHEQCTTFNVYRDGEWADNSIEEELTELIRGYMQYIYRQLEREHDYLTSEALFLELADYESWLYTESGELVE